MNLRKEPIHYSIKRRLGYAEDEADEDVYEDWKQRLRRVCKPCWELRYCPYGPFVEQSPILPGEKDGQVEHVRYLKSCIQTGTVGEIVDLDDQTKQDYTVWLKDEQVLIAQVLTEWTQADHYDTIGKIEDDEERLAALFSNNLPPIHEYRIEFDDGISREYLEDDFSPMVWAKIQAGVAERKKELKSALASGRIDTRKPLEPARREMFEHTISDFNPDDFPEKVPSIFRDGECAFFGHICPVFFTAEIATESELERRIGRRHLKFETMMRIVRRDDYRCQHCKKKLRDDEVEFDHIIPVSKGGSSEEHNMRLTCFGCNRDKSNDYNP